MNSNSALKMSLLVSLLLSLGLTTAQAAPKQSTIWVDVKAILLILVRPQIAKIKCMQEMKLQ